MGPPARRLVKSAVLLLLLTACIASDADLEGFDEPDTPSRRQRTDTPHDEVFIKPAPVEPAARIDKAQKQRQRAAAAAKKPQGIFSASAMASRLTAPVNIYIEATAGILILLYIVVIILGRQSNHKIGAAWARAFAMKGTIMDRNFSYTGPKESGALLMKESGNVFKFYASGRRYCSGLLAELQLLARQDVLSLLWNLFSPAEDQIKVEVFMHEANMPPIVLAIATPKHARNLQRDMLDVSRYTKRIHVGKDVFPAGDKLWILAEHSSIFQDLFSDPKLQQMFSFGGSSSASMKLFRSLHITSENSEGTHKQVLRFVFKVPPAEQMESLAGMMELVPLFIDLVGTYKLPADLKKRALDARAKQAEDDEEQRRKRQEALQQKRMDKAQEERAKLLRMTPEARQKAEEKLQRQQMKKAMKLRTVRM